MSCALYLPAIVILLAGFISEGAAYEIDKCHCWNDMNETLREKIDENAPKPQKYQYIGVKPTAKYIFISCICSDVTRVETSFTLKSEQIYKLAVNETDYENAKLTAAIEATLKKGDKDGIIVNVAVEYEGNGTSPNTTWKIEVVVRGTDDSTVHTDITNMFKAASRQSNGSYSLPDGVGPYDVSTLNFEVIQCTGDPIKPSANGKITWSKKRLPGVRATYSCNDGYFISEPSLAFSDCDHINVTWIEPSTNITCKKGCQGEPPTDLFFTVRNWNPTLREGGDEAIYMCMDRYKSKDGMNGSSVCDGNTAIWSNVSKNYECILIKCLGKIPQVAAYAKPNWKDNNAIDIGTKVIYSCIEDYYPNMKGTIQSECSSRGEWTSLPKKFKCYDYKNAKERGILELNAGPTPKSFYRDDSDHTDVTIMDSLSLIYVLSYSFAIIGSIVFLCLCCTRPSSPLYRLCTAEDHKRTSKFVYF